MSVFEAVQMVLGGGLSTVLGFAVVTLWRSLESTRKTLGEKLDVMSVEWRRDLADRAAQVERALSQEVECRRQLADLGIRIERMQARLDVLGRGE